jgi:hypothetical protein
MPNQRLKLTGAAILVSALRCLAGGPGSLAERSALEDGLG